MIARRRHALALGAIVLGFALGAEKAPKQSEKKESAPATWYAQLVSGGDTPLRVDYFWSKGRKLRSETVLGGYPLLTLVSGEFYYVIDPIALTGIAVRRSPAALQADRANAGERPFGNEGALLTSKGAEKIRDEKLDGRPVQVFRLTDDRGRREIWVSSDERRLPLRIDTFDRQSGAHVRTDYVDWSGGLDLPDSFFEPDPRVQLERLEYDEYVKRSTAGPVGPAPVLFRDLLHGK